MMLKWWHKVFEDGFAHECMKDWISNSLKTSHILLNQFSYEVWGYGDANMSSVVLPRKRHININGSTCLSFSGHYDLNDLWFPLCCRWYIKVIDKVAKT
jgi:hypothetical protein